MDGIISNWKNVVLGHYADFGGRAGRAEYWYFVLVQFVVGLVLSVLAEASALFSLVSFVWWAATLVPSIAVAVRRLHDTGRSGLWLLIAFIPIVGVIVLIVFLATSGDAAPNQYGQPVTSGATVAPGATGGFPPPPPPSGL